MTPVCTCTPARRSASWVSPAPEVRTLGFLPAAPAGLSGAITFNGTRLDGLSQRALRPLRRDMQVVFQDPYSSLSPRLTVEQIVGEGLRIHFPLLDRAARRARVLQALEEVGLSADMLWRYPHESLRRPASAALRSPVWWCWNRS